VYAIADVQVRQTDTAGNLSAAATNAAAINTDMTNAAPSFALNTDSGSLISDKLTNDATVDVTLASDVDSWEYSVDGGTTWATGTGTSFELADDTAYAIDDVQVRQTDTAGNLSTPATNTAAIETDMTNAGPSFALNTDTGSSISDKLTNDATIVVTLAADVASWRYSSNGGTTWSMGSGTSFELANNQDYSIGSIKVEQTDNAGNTSDIRSNSVQFSTDMIAPAKPSFTLPTDTGQSSSDAITNASTVSVSLASEPVTWEYSLDAGTTWNAGTIWNAGSATSFELADDTAYSIGEIQVRQTDAAGNTSDAITSTTAITTDMTVAAVGISLANDTGFSNSDGISNDSTVNVSLAGDVASWQYSLDAGATWSTGVSTSFELANDTPYTTEQVQVKQTDVAGNTSDAASAAITFTTDQTVAVGTLALATDTGRYSTDELTNDATVNVTLASDVASWEYNLNNTVWQTGSGTSFELADDTTYSGSDIDIRQTDKAGNVSEVNSFTKTIRTDMTVATPTLYSDSDSGDSSTDWITNNNLIYVNRETSDATYIYSLDGGTTWSDTETGSYFSMVNNTTYAIDDIQVIQTDIAGNVSEMVSNATEVKEDSTAGMISIALATDTGTAANDNITNDLTVDVTLTTDVSNWRYTVNGGANWATGSGNSFELAKNTVYSVGVIQVTQTDIAGNTTNVFRNSDIITTDTSTNTVVSFTSETDDGNYKEGDPIQLTATTSEVVKEGMAFVVTLDSGKTVTLTAAADGLTLVGSYVIGAGDNSTDLTISSITSGDVTDIASNILDTDISDTSNLAANSDLVVNTTAPTNTLTNATYNVATDTLVLTGTNINSLLSTGETSSTNIIGNFDFTKFQWDFDSDNTDNMVSRPEMFTSVEATNDTTLTLNLSYYGALALEGTAGFDNLTVDDSIEITAGFSGDTAGNVSTTDAADIAATIPAAENIVVFDLVGGTSSDHSGQIFKVDTPYTIYIRVDSDVSNYLKTDENSGNGTWNKWGGAENLGNDDRIILVGNNNNDGIEGMHGGDITDVGENNNAIVYRTSINISHVLEVGGNGVVIRLNTWGPTSRDIWDGNVQGMSLDNGASNDLFTNTMPIGIMTSQGLA
jgi:hypothetical protein